MRWRLACAVMLAAFWVSGACGKAPKRPEGYRILCTTYPVWLFTRAVVGSLPGTRVELLLPADAGCPHEFILQSEDVRRLSAADVLVINGLGLDAFVEERFRSMRPRAPVIVATEGIPDVLPPADKGARRERAMARGSANPHLFASPYQASRMVRTIAKKLGRLRPSAAEAYSKNAERWVRSLGACGDELKRAVAVLRTRTIVTQHSVFDYLARDTGLQIAGVIAVRDGEEPSAAEMLSIIRRARAVRAGAVFTEPQYSSRLGEQVAKQAGIPHATLDPVATGPPNADPDYYLTTMHRNAVTLRKVLGARP